MMNKKGGKKEVTFSFYTLVEATILEEWQKNLTMNFYCKEKVLDIYVKQISKT